MFKLAFLQQTTCKPMLEIPCGFTGRAQHIGRMFCGERLVCINRVKMDLRE